MSLFDEVRDGVRLLAGVAIVLGAFWYFRQPGHDDEIGFAATVLGAGMIDPDIVGVWLKAIPWPWASKQPAAKQNAD